MPSRFVEGDLEGCARKLQWAPMARKEPEREGEEKEASLRAGLLGVGLEAAEWSERRPLRPLPSSWSKDLL